MSTVYPDLFAALGHPFESHEVKVRQAPGGRPLNYITARTAMNRLDQVLGPENWWDEYVPLENSVICKLSIRLPDGHVVTKADAGGYAGMADQGDDDKSGFSDAFKRACAKMGIARYLYRDGVPAFVRERQPEATPEPTKEPAPAPVRNQEAEPPSLEPASRPAGPRDGQISRSAPEPVEPARFDGDGRAFFRRIKQLEEQFGPEVVSLGRVMEWAKGRGIDARVVDWSAGLLADANGYLLSLLPGEPPPPPADPGPRPPSNVPAYQLPPKMAGATPEESLGIRGSDPDKDLKLVILAQCKELARRACDLAPGEKPPAERVVDEVRRCIRGYSGQVRDNNLSTIVDSALLKHMEARSLHELDTLDMAKGVG